MISKNVSIVIFAILALCSRNALAESRKILIIGDSLTEGFGVNNQDSFPTLLETKLKAGGCPTCVVINSGSSGSTSAGAKKRLEWQLKGSKPEILILALGANDGLRGVEVKATKENLEQVIQLAKEKGIKVLLAGMLVPPNYGKEYFQAFSAMYPDLSKKYQLPLIPFLLDGVAGNPKLNLPDGIHPNAEGHKIVAENVAKELRKML